MQRSKSQQPGKGPKAGTQCLVLDQLSGFYGQIVTVLSDPYRIDEDLKDYSDAPVGEFVSNLEHVKEDRSFLIARSALLIPIPPPAKAARMFGEKAVTA